MLDEKQIALAMAPEARRRFDVHVVQSTGSTNADLMAQASGLPGGHVLAAEAQTAGRGRRGRAWVSRPGDSLTFSLLWKFRSGAPMTGLSLAVGLGAVRALDRCGAGQVMLKWPNDLLVGVGNQWAKLGGILIEVVAGPGATATVVIGIGLNIRPVGEAAAIGQVTASLEALGWKGSRNTLLAALLEELREVLDVFESGGFAPFAAAWNARHAFRDRQVILSGMQGGSVTGVARGAHPDGALALDTDDGPLQIVSGDVSLRAMPQ
jgi:BirA family transcriptional regulator, biotin operon repressor / biotin---[acetyl-CoA-carboxylase] ligase